MTIELDTISNEKLIDMLSIASDCSIIQYFNFYEKCFYIEYSRTISLETQLHHAYNFICACENFLHLHFTIEYSKRFEDTIIIKTR